jgi:hypothetical protein
MLIKYGNKECKLAVWKKGKKIKGRNANEYRRCRMSNNIIRYSHYGKKKSKYILTNFPHKTFFRSISFFLYSLFLFFQFINICL